MFEPWSNDNDEDSADSMEVDGVENDELVPSLSVSVFRSLSNISKSLNKYTPKNNNM